MFVFFRYATLVAKEREDGKERRGMPFVRAYKHRSGAGRNGRLGGMRAMRE